MPRSPAARRVRPRSASFCSRSGVLMVIGKGDPLALLNGGVNGGDVLVFLGAASFVVYTFGARRFGGLSSLRYTALTATGGTVTVLAVTEVATLAGWLTAPSMGDVTAIWSTTPTSS